MLDSQTVPFSSKRLTFLWSPDYSVLTSLEIPVEVVAIVLEGRKTEEEIQR